VGIVTTVLDRTSEGPVADVAVADAAAADDTSRAALAPAAGMPRRGWRFFVTPTFSGLTRRLLFLHVAGPLPPVAGILHPLQFPARLLVPPAPSLLVQGEIIAGALAASATVETNAITIDPDKLLEL